MSANILRSAVLRAVEARAQPDAVPSLMERAGLAAALVAQTMLPSAPAAVLVLAGPGNNGGDAFVVARWLKAAGHGVDLVFTGAADRLPADARAAHDAWHAAGGTFQPTIPPRKFALVVDGLFGIGLTRSLSGTYAELIRRINAGNCPILALDIPSGLDADTGCVMGCAVRATHTATFIALKPGLLTGDGPDHCGEISLHDLDLVYDETDGVVNGIDLFREHLQLRPRNSHKGSFGSAGIVGGAAGMAGAALLAGRAALKLGAGRVYVGMLERCIVDAAQPELMLRDAEAVFALATAIAIGPGLGQSAAALDLLRRAIDQPLPLLIDADGINLLAAHPVLQQHLAQRTAPTLLTPHPAEAARLLGIATAAVQANRIAAALQLAARCKANIVLKGCGSIVADAAGQWAINTSGNAGLAAAGSGDVLSGIILALLAQGWPAPAALLCGVQLHGAAADALVQAGCGPIGLCASELIDPARALFNHWTADARH